MTVCVIVYRGTAPRRAGRHARTNERQTETERHRDRERQRDRAARDTETESDRETGPRPERATGMTYERVRSPLLLETVAAEGLDDKRIVTNGEKFRILHDRTDP